MVVDYYNALKLKRNATEDDSRRTYKRLAMKWQPDKNPINKKEAETKFRQISEAYDVLPDPRKRRIYDLYGDEALASAEFTPASGSRFRLNSRDADEIFAEFFGGSTLKLRKISDKDEKGKSQTRIRRELGELRRKQWNECRRDEWTHGVGISVHPYQISICLNFYSYARK